MAGTPQGLFRRFAHPLLQEQSGTARQTRQNIHHTIQYRKARSAASQTPSEHRNAQGMVTGGRRGEAVGHRPPFPCVRGSLAITARGPQIAIAGSQVLWCDANPYVFWDFLAFLLFEEFLAFSVFSLLFQGFEGFGRDGKSLFFLGGFPSFPEKARKRRSGKLEACNTITVPNDAELREFSMRNGNALLPITGGGAVGVATHDVPPPHMYVRPPKEAFRRRANRELQTVN